MSDKKIVHLPVIALRGMCVLPKVNINIDVVRRKSYDAMEAALERDSMVFLVSQINHVEETLRTDNLNKIGVIAKINKAARIPGNIARINVTAISRARIITYDNSSESYLQASLEEIESYNSVDGVHTEAMVSELGDLVVEYAMHNPTYALRGSVEISMGKNMGDDIDAIAGDVEITLEAKQRILAEADVYRRGIILCGEIYHLNKVLKVKKEIDSKVKGNIEKEQRKHILREQLRVITDELEEENANPDIEKFYEKMESLDLPQYAVDKLNDEIARLKRIPGASPESSVITDYINVVLSLPWNVYSRENNSLEKAIKILDRDHFGLKKVKERIIEFLAVKLYGSSEKGSILCLVGPPGVGKTSIARSVATALDRKYVRLSLGGIHDEAEIRGHRRTYIGAMPGRIINAIKQAGTQNPLVLLDEIDKMASDYKGDPASAMLEVLDGEQNSTFRDNYIEIPFDLSKVLFICTANSLDTIPAPLRDRMDIIQLSSYTSEEKLNIVKKYLYPKQLKAYGLEKDDLKINQSGFKAIIEEYTAEAGVRQAERYIEKLCSVAIKNKLINEEMPKVTDKSLKELIGKPIYHKEKLLSKNEVGVCRGLAWTSVGGTTMEIEVNVYEGKGNVKITGNVGKVMEESAIAAFSYIRANADILNITADFNSLDVHIHVPQGATPKDGPSAGVTMVTAMVSALTGIPVKRDIAMTGEVNIRGRVMPIGGLKEKVLAAKAIGVKTVILPYGNQGDLDEIEDYAKEGLSFVTASSVGTVLGAALAKEV